MSIQAVSYEDFLTEPQAFTKDGGPWIGVPSDSVEYEDDGFECAPRPCLGAYGTYLGSGPTTFQASLTTNISVNLANYGGATSLGFTWNYQPLYCGFNYASGSDVTAGSHFPITSQVGNATFEDSIPTAANCTAAVLSSSADQWNNAPQLSRQGSTSVVRGSDPNLGYIVIQINITMAPTGTEEMYLWVQGIKFLITTPTQSVTAASSSSTSTQQVNGSSATPSSGTTPAGVVAGAVIGALAFVTLFILAICLFRRQRKKGKSTVDDTVIHTQQANHEAPAPMEEGPFPPSHLVTSYSAQPTSSASLRPASVFSHGTYGPPPIYRPDEWTGQDRPPLTPSSPELARFAAANRDAINDNLEARLQAAGYVPTQDPSRLTPEEWKNEYGITKLELDRLQTLYARTQQDQRK